MKIFSHYDKNINLYNIKLNFEKDVVSSEKKSKLSLSLFVFPFLARISWELARKGEDSWEKLVYPISFQDRANNRALPYICKHARRMSLTSNKKSPSAHTEIWSTLMLREREEGGKTCILTLFLLIYLITSIFHQKIFFHCFFIYYVDRLSQDKIAWDNLTIQWIASS